MHRHLSTSVSTIVALMAAHRATSGREGAPTAFCQDEVARIDAYLRDADTTAEAEEQTHDLAHFTVGEMRPR